MERGRKNITKGGGGRRKRRKALVENSPAPARQSAKAIFFCNHPVKGGEVFLRIGRKRKEGRKEHIRN